MRLARIVERNERGAVAAELLNKTVDNALRVQHAEDNPNADPFDFLGGLSGLGL
ncbi:hypothetical protein AB0K81_32525 [Streptomyces werraensis]|uniref:Uncharacterized protein n=1 Tax=Streptomyces werraensis TaxID=68284 RepID=A0ABV3JPA4_9ACTN